jgi:hypothetical protein
MIEYLKLEIIEPKLRYFSTCTGTITETLLCEGKTQAEVVDFGVLVLEHFDHSLMRLLRNATGC